VQPAPSLVAALRAEFGRQLAISEGVA
jgi:hypothetical protein